MIQRSSALRLFLALALCATASPAAAQLYPGFDASTPIGLVYRAEVTPPSAAFTAGFHASGTIEDLLWLTSGVPCNNAHPSQSPAWVSTTADREQAIAFARRYLEPLPLSGRNYPVYIYEIRADAQFISVPGAFYTAIDAGRAARSGYTPDHANALEYLLYTRPILGERSVVVAHVPPRNIANATAVWLENGALVESGTATFNAGYEFFPTAATNVVPDWRLPILLPPQRIFASQAGASGTCAMACDRATSASSFSLSGQIDYATQCSQSDAMTPLLFDIIND